MNWTPPLRPAAYAEQTLIEAILSGVYPAGGALPAERELAVQLGITRPTLRETLQRLERDGWLSIQHGKPTRVTDFWSEGGLNVLHALARNPVHLPPDFTRQLLEVRLALAPAYGRLAVARQAAACVALLAEAAALTQSPAGYAAFDWHLHHSLTCLSGNPIYSLILNGFKSMYANLAEVYFVNPQAQAASQRFYSALQTAATAGDADAAEEIIIQAMQRSLDLWQEVA